MHKTGFKCHDGIMVHDGMRFITFEDGLLDPGSMTGVGVADNPLVMVFS